MFDLSPDDITEGPVLRALLVLAAPLLAQNVVQVFQQVVDLFWVGRLDNAGDAVAAVGLVVPLQALVFGFAVFIPFVGTQVLVSQRIGADDVVGARRGVGSGLLAALGLGVGVGVVGILLAPALIDLITSVRPEGVGESVGPLAVAYFSVLMLVLPLITLSDTTEAAFVGWGDSRVALYMNVLAIGLNAVLDPIFIFGFEENPAFALLGLGGVADSLYAATGFAGLGVEGAALATGVGYGVGFLLGAALLLAGRNGGMTSRSAFRIDLAEQRELFDIGLPMAGQQVAKQVADLALVVLAFSLGGAAGLAAYFVGFRVAGVAVIPSLSLQQAAQSVVGQNLGAGLVGRARTATWHGAGIAVTVLGLLGVVQWVVPELIVVVLAPQLDAAGVALTVEYLRVLALGYPAIGAAYLFQAGFNGASETRTSFLASLAQYWGVRLPFALVGGLALAWGVSAVFWAVTLSNVAAALGLAFYYYYSAENGRFDPEPEGAAPN
ncbi:MATE family efflux transporter [Halomarina ordinaria]|uniref:Multidrug-efflux transporter n=1 Tax=Halomarina ordinaria TaxID=3033939 RepID=A0ABD5UE57_9EURY|nr:MATE family efflux transporter [Halomarina sp. PSRA2]